MVAGRLIENNKRRAEEKLTELCRQQTSLQEMERNAQGILFGDFLVKWLEEKCAKLSPTTCRSYESYRVKYIQPNLGNHPLSAITFRDIEGYYYLLEQKGLSSTTILHHHAMLRQAFTYACKYEMLAVNPMLKEHNIRHISYHDLRYSCAGLLHCSRTPLIEVPHWLGHSTMLTTADLYAHLDDSLKDRCAQNMKKLGFFRQDFEWQRQQK